MAIFNKNRMSFLSKKSITKYLLYGIGEIILVVIGILIAVSINNRNQQQAAEKKLASYLQVYQEDLKQDTTMVGNLLKNYLDKRKENFKIFLSDTVTADTYKTNLDGYGLILSYSPYKLQKKGINLLEDYVDDNKTEQDSLISRIVTNHRLFEDAINNSYDRIGDDIDNNMLYFKENHPWIADLLRGRLTNPKIMEYYLSDAYQARLTIHSTLLFGNLEPQLNAFQSESKQTLEMIDQRLSSDR